MMSSLVEFLRARLAEDEARAQKDIWIADHASAGTWQAWYGHNLPHSDVRADGQIIAAYNGAAHEGDAMLAQRFKPANVRDRGAQMLAEVAAKRRIVELWEREDRDRHHHAEGEARAWLMDEMLQALALPYVDHSDYEPAWSDHIG